MNVDPTIIRFTLDCNKTVEELVAVCKFSEHHHTVTSAWFSLPGTGILEFEAKLFRYDGPPEPDCGCCDLQKVDRFIADYDPERPWHSGLLPHLLGFFPKLPLHYDLTTIAAIGEAVRGTVPYVLWTVTGGPYLEIDSDLEFFADDTAFLGVRRAT